MLITNLTVTQVIKHVYRPCRVDKFFQLPVGDSFILPGCPSHPGCIARGNACSTEEVIWGRRPHISPHVLRLVCLTLRAMSHARTLHDPCIQRFSGGALTVADDNESDGVSPCFESDKALFHA